MGFRFSSTHKVEVEVEGKLYTINMGDAKTLDELQGWAEDAGAVDYASLTPGQLQELSGEVERFLRITLGDAQFDDVFERRTFDLVDGLELLAYIYEEIGKSGASLYGGLGKYVPEK